MARVSFGQGSGEGSEKGSCSHARAGLVLLGMAAALACGAHESDAPDGADEPRVRIVLMTLDTLRRDGFATEDGRTSPMPNVAAFAKRGQSFERFYSASSATQPSHASLFTGLHPWQHGVDRNGVVLSADRDTVAERLRGAGFETRAVVASFPLDARFGFARGFDSYSPCYERDIGLEDFGGEIVEGRRFYALSEAVADEALRILGAASSRKQFFWFHFFDPHDPYGDSGPRRISVTKLRRLAAESSDRLTAEIADARSLYVADLAYLDTSLGRIFAKLEDDAPAVETHVILVSDHGESFGEDGSFGHGDRVSPLQVHVPLVVVSPRFAPGLRGDVAGSVDVAATLLALAGVDRGSIGGRDLTQPAPRTDGSAFGMSDAARASADSPPRFFAAARDGLFSGHDEVIAEDDDPVRSVEEARARELRLLFGSFAQNLAARHAETPDPAPVDDETRAALEALGYAH